MSNMNHSRRGINRRLTISLTPSLIARMEMYVDKRGPDECWPWKRAPRNGYGAIRHEGRVLGAHRVVYVMACGEPPEGTIVTHQCDNRLCCNPSHLRAGTPRENNREACERNRRTFAGGVLSYSAVLNDEIVAEIWRLKKTGLGHVRIARQLSLNKWTVKTVTRGVSWRHLIPDWAKQT